MKPRPLSPHLQIYKWQITMILSICHRASGIALGLGTLLLVSWLLCLALGPSSFSIINLIINHWFGQFVLFGYSVVIFYHFFNGIRHLMWDFGYGYEMNTVYTTGYLVIIFSLILTAIIWTIVWFL